MSCALLWPCVPHPRSHGSSRRYELPGAARPHNCVLAAACDCRRHPRSGHLAVERSLYLSLRFLCSSPPARPLACVGCVQHVRRLPPGRPSYAKAVVTCVPAIPMQPERYMCLFGHVVSLLRLCGHPSPFSFAWRLTLVCTCRSVAGHSRTVHANKPPARSSMAAI